MSFADYSQLAEDHTSLLILIKPVGNQLKPKNFNKIFDRISHLQSLTISTASSSLSRTISLRYRKYYPIENNAWGDYQVHRRVLGIITIGKCDDSKKTEELVRLHEDLKEQYEGTLLDSRLILFGKLDFDGTNSGCQPDKEDANSNVLQPDSNAKNGLKPFQDALTAERSMSQSATSLKVPDVLDLQNAQKNLSHIQSEPVISNGKCKEPLAYGSQILRYIDEDHCSDLEDKIQEFLNSLFWVLESKRLDRSHERLDHLYLLTAPFERKDSTSGDSDSRLHRKKCLGRFKKHLGDLSLLAGVPGESALYYQTSLDMLKPANDWLWMAGAQEGLAVAHFVIHRPKSIKLQPFLRNLSFSVKRGPATVKDVKLQNTKYSKLGTFPNRLDLADSHTPSIQTETLPEEILNNYKEAVINYSKIKEAGIVEMEASLKACRVLTIYQRALEAADFLQNVVRINLPLMEEEKIEQFMTLSSLYADINMMRKSAFYSRIAAMVCVAPSNQKQSWPQCYHLLIRSFSGFRLSLDPKEMPLDASSGWPSIKLRILHELIYSARRMGDAAIAIRHLSLLLHTMYEHLQVNERTELFNVMRSYTSKCEGTPLSIALDDGTILPPVPFTRFPIVRSLRLLKLVPHYRPVRFRSDQPSEPLKLSTDSPFIYSPLTLSASNSESASHQPELRWVEGDTCEVALQLVNPLSFELHVVNIGLMTEGVEVLCHPASIALSPESGPTQVKILVTPKHPGQLTVTGYTTEVMGVKSQCRLRDLSHLVTPHCTTHVVSALPLIQVATSLPKAEQFCTMADGDCVVTTGSLTFYAGQSAKFDVRLLNVGKLPVDRIDVTLNSCLKNSLLERLIRWSHQQLQSQLPLKPGSQATLVVNVFALSDFLSPSLQTELDSVTSLPTNSNGDCSMKGLRDFTDSSGIVNLEFLMFFQYSGGDSSSPGDGSAYCRQCSISLSVEILPSVYISGWHVEQSLSADECIFKVDLENATQNTISFHQECGTHLASIDSGQSARILFPIPRYNSNSASNQSVLVPAIESITDDDKLKVGLLRHIQQQVNLQWTMSSSGSTGTVNVERIWFSKSQCALLQTSLVGWEVTIDGERLTPDGAVAAQCMRPISVSIGLTNRSGSELFDVSLDVLPCQCVASSDDGQKLQPSHGDIVTIGLTRNNVDELPPGGRIVISCSLLFPWIGVFSLNCTCRARLTRRSADLDSSSCFHEWQHLVTMELTNTLVTYI